MKYVVFIILSAGLLLLLIGLKYNLYIYDEGVGLLGAERIINGDIPYRDFWSMYAPGNFYLLAMVCNIFGWTVLSGRILFVIIAYLTALTFYYISRRFLNKYYSLIPFVGIIILFSGFPQYSKPIPPTFLLTAFSILFFLRFLESGKKGNILILGLCNGLAILFRHDIGIYFLISNLIIIFTLFVGKSTKIQSFKEYILLNCLFISMIALDLIFPVIYFISKAGFNNLYEQLIFVPYKIFPQFRSSPIPNPLIIFFPKQTGLSFFQILKTLLETVYFYFPITIYAVYLFGFFLKKELIRKKLNERKTLFLIYLTLTGIIFLPQSFIRSDFEHSVPTLVISIMIFSILLFSFPSRKKNIIGFIILALLFIIPVQQKVRSLWSEFGKNSNSTDMARASGFILPSLFEEDLHNAVTYLQSHLSPGEKFFSGCDRHNKFIFNDVLLYFLTAHLPCTKYHELHPGVATTSKVQKEIIREIHTMNIRYIVLFKNPQHEEQNLSNVSSRVFLLDNFIKTNFLTIENYGIYSILKKIQ